MTISSRILRCALVFLTLLTGQGSSSGQTLYDVVISLSDRQRVINQQEQVSVYLSNQTNDPASLDAVLPADFPIDWLELGTDPTQSAVDGLAIGGKIALLNQAVAEFDGLKFAFLNSNPAEFDAGLTVGSLKPYLASDFDPLPRATTENYQDLLRLLAQQVRSLRLITWSAGFRERSFIDESKAEEFLVYDDPSDANNDGNHEARVEIHDEITGGILESVEWKPDSIGPGNTHIVNPSSSTRVAYSSSSNVSFFGIHRETTIEYEENTFTLNRQSIGINSNYPEDALLRSTAPGSDGVQIDGTVYILHRSIWNQNSVAELPSQYERSNAGYVVDGSGNSGSVALIASAPTGTVTGSWFARDPTNSYFIEAGYENKETWVGEATNPGYLPDFGEYYEQKWGIGCVFHTVFKPTFTRGVDDPTMRQKLESAYGILADSSADGELLLQPRPSLLFGIRLGPGLKGAGNGYISGGSMGDSASPFVECGDWAVQDLRKRFDSSYSLQFAGSCSDYHVVYENNRSARTQSLPTDGLGWPYTDSDESQDRDIVSLYRAWDSPRLKQIAGRDLVADITYDSSHYGGYTVKVYRRPTGSSALTPGNALNISGMTLIRTWTFSHPGAGVNAHPSDAEKLQVVGSGGEKYEIQANMVRPNQGLGWPYWNYHNSSNWWRLFYAPDWWRWTAGAHSWTLKLSQGNSEKFKKEIDITTSTAANGSFVWASALRESLDDQLVSALTSETLNPFRASYPKDWKITSAAKTITGSATLGASGDRATRYGTLPTSLTIDYDGIQPVADYTWNTSGLLSSFTQGPWSIAGVVQGGAYKQTHKLNNSTVSTDWTELSEGGNKVKTSSSANGASGAPVAWTEVEYGTATTGLPGLPHIVRNSDGSGATYQWEWISPSNENQLTLTEGLISGSSVSRGSRSVRNTNEHGHSTGSESFLINGGTIQTGGSVLSDPTAWGAPTKSTDYSTGLTSTWAYDNNLSRLSTHTGSLGVLSEFSGYDVLGRPATVSHNGISAANTYNAFSTTSVITGSATGNLAETRDALGRLTRSNHTWNGVTDDLTITPGSATVITREQTLLGTHTATLRQNDGTLTASAGPTQPFGGTAGTALTVDNGLLKSTSNLADQTAAYQTTWTDAWGRLRKTETPNGPTNILYSDPTSTLQRVRVTEPTGRKLITESDPYTSSGAITRSGIDVNGNGELGASDRYVESITTVASGKLVTTLSLTENTGLREILRTQWTPSGNLTVTKINGNEETITRTPNYTTKTITTTSSKGWGKSETFNNLGLTTNSTLSGAGVPAANLTPNWRADGSLEGVTFTTGGDTHSATFNDNGTLATLTAPGKGNILGGHSISAGVETLTVDGNTTVTKLDGTQITTSGSDVIGKTETLAVSGSGFQQTTDPVIGSNTTTDYNAAAAPTAKNYAAGAGEARQYLAGGLLQKITLARGGDLTFGYSPDGAKDLESATWPQVTSGSPVFFTIPGQIQGYTYDRAARVKTLTDASGSRTLGYDRGRLANTVWNSGPLAGYKVVKGLDNQGRDTGFELWQGNTMIHASAKTFTGVNSESDEVFSVTASGFNAVLGRNGARSLETVTRGAVTQRWQRGTAGRILLADSNSTVAGAPTFDYKGTANNEATSFDAKGRRLKVKTAGADWTYQYTSGQLTSAIHPTLGSFSYQFDGIGRRKNHAGSGNYADLLNRTLDWENTGNKTLKIAAHPDARVWLKVGTAPTFEISSFTGSYEHPLPFPSGSGIWQAWNTLAVLEGEGDVGANPDAKSEQGGAVWVPPTNENFGYDLAGNRESTALWDFGWNAKNELVRARTKNHNNPSTPQGYDITNACDAEGRRFSKKVNRYQNGSVVEQKVITFLHDGDDIIYERHQLPSGLTICERKYVWGPDISGTHGGAGGAGGLLLIRETKGNQTIDLYPLYDGTGHVVALADNTGTLQAEYAYGPFGENIHARGPHAQSCPFRFQTKYLDQETGLYNFGLRFLDPITGQWLSREPLGESESLNLYSLTGNDPINHVDVLGLEKRSLIDRIFALGIEPIRMEPSPQEKTRRQENQKEHLRFLRFLAECQSGQMNEFTVAAMEEFQRQLLERSRLFEQQMDAAEALAKGPQIRPVNIDLPLASQRSLSIGGPPGLWKANVDLVLPIGAGAAGAKFAFGGMKMFLPAMMTGARVEGEILAATKTTMMRQPGLDTLPLSRTKVLGTVSTTDELLATGAIPGREGVILGQRTVSFSDIWKMSDRAGAEFILTREGGSFMLRSGSLSRAPIAPGVRPIIHTHPLNANGYNSLLPSNADINVLNSLWNFNPNGVRPVSQIITGPNSTTIFRATGLDPLR